MTKGERLRASRNAANGTVNALIDASKKQDELLQGLNKAVAKATSLEKTLLKSDASKENGESSSSIGSDNAILTDEERTAVVALIQELRELITYISDEWRNLNITIQDLADEIHNNSQYLRRWNLLLHNLKDVPTLDEEGKNVVGFRFSAYVAKKLNELFPNAPFPINWEEICISHLLRLRNTASIKKVIVVRFVRRDVRNWIFYNKSILKGTGVAISEHLTQRNITLLNYAKSCVGRNQAWSDQGVIYIIHNKRKISVSCVGDFDDLNLVPLPEYKEKRSYKDSMTGDKLSSTIIASDLTVY